MMYGVLTLHNRLVAGSKKNYLGLPPLPLAGVRGLLPKDFRGLTGPGILWVLVRPLYL